jgi:hypothetical protein
MKQLSEMTEPELRDFCNLIGHNITRSAEISWVEKPMFVVLLFNDPSVAQYVSNCNREDIIKALRETADRLDKREDVER